MEVSSEIEGMGFLSKTIGKNHKSFLKEAKINLCEIAQV